MNQITVFFDHIRNACKQENKSLEEIVAELTLAGISGVEIEYTDICTEEGERLVNKLSEIGLPVVSVYCHFRWELETPVQDIDEVLSRLNRLGIKNLLAIPGFKLPGQDSIQSREMLINPLKELCEKAAKVNVKVGMEDFDDDVAAFSKAEDLKWFLDQIPELGCAFDTGNFLYQEEDSLEVLPQFLDRITYVHCKDRSLIPVEGEDYKETVGGSKLYSSPVGSGVISMTKILQTIKETGYEGVFAIEHFGSLHQLRDMLESAHYLRDFI